MTVAPASADYPHESSFRLPLPGWPRACFRSDFGYREGRLEIDGAVLLDRLQREELLAGVGAVLAGGRRLALQLDLAEGVERLRIEVDGRAAPAESSLTRAPSRSAWIHGFIGLGASAAGFVAGYLYLAKAAQLASPWAGKMGYHTAAWHLLLVLALFPASVWGQRLGIRAVQGTSAVFFCIHLGIALANALWPDTGSLNDVWIALFNGLSGALFLASVIYGNRAHHDMDPVAALREIEP